MLETVRQYAQERLAASGDADALRARHAAHYLEFAERGQPALLGPQQAAWFARFDLERENLLLVHEWCGTSTAMAPHWDCGSCTRPSPTC